MDRTPHHPFSVPMFFTTRMLDQPPEQAYLSTKGDILGTDGFVANPLQGQLIHGAFILGETGVQELWVPGKSLMIADAWNSPQAADEAIHTLIEPALTGAGIPQPERVSGVELIGCLAADVSDFDAEEAFAIVQVWPDLREDATELYTAIFDEVIGHHRSLPVGTGVHFAYRLGNQVISWEISRSQALYEQAMAETIMPAVRGVFHKFGVSGEPTTIPARPLGLAVREEVRYCKAA